MIKNGYMTGSELRQYLHISTRKMKYFMDHNLIPHINTGHPTHKYLIKVKDAEIFKYRMDSEVGFLSELRGQFTAGKREKPILLLKITDDNCYAFKRFVTGKWKDIPDAVSIKQSAIMLGCNQDKIREHIKSGVLHGIKVYSVYYLCKDELVEYISSKEKLSAPTSELQKRLIREFMAES